VVLGAPGGAPSRRRLLGRATGTLAVAWLDPGAPLAELLARNASLVAACSGARAGNMTVTSVLFAYVSAPPCDALSGLCACPNGAPPVNTRATNDSCVAQLPPPPPSPPPLALAAASGLGAGAVAGIAAGAAAVTACAVLFAWRATRERRREGARQRKARELALSYIPRSDLRELSKMLSASQGRPALAL
jgi:hypothetical protein